MAVVVPLRMSCKGRGGVNVAMNLTSSLERLTWGLGAAAINA